MAKDIYLSPLVLPKDIFFSFMESKLNTVKKYKSENSKKLIEALESFSKMSAFEDQLQDTYAPAVVQSKAWLLQLDEIRKPQGSISIDQIFSKEKTIGTWWDSVQIQ